MITSYRYRGMHRATLRHQGRVMSVLFGVMMLVGVVIPTAASAAPRRTEIGGLDLEGYCNAKYEFSLPFEASSAGAVPDRELKRGSNPTKWSCLVSSVINVPMGPRTPVSVSKLEVHPIHMTTA